jgi:hypothetical protein
MDDAVRGWSGALKAYRPSRGDGVPSVDCNRNHLHSRGCAVACSNLARSTGIEACPARDAPSTKEAPGWRGDGERTPLENREVKALLDSQNIEESRESSRGLRGQATRAGCADSRRHREEEAFPDNPGEGSDNEDRRSCWR